MVDKDAVEISEVQHDSGYGDFIRVDINGDYGDLGAHMYAVRWDYYGDGDTVLATYGTKFAADNWMHKSMGIQLGLTKSDRCQLPEGTDGYGRWDVYRLCDRLSGLHIHSGQRTGTVCLRNYESPVCRLLLR